VIAERLLLPGHALVEDAWRVRFTRIIEPMQRLETAGQAWPLKHHQEARRKCRVIIVYDVCYARRE
jgi:hypothetical protein